MNILVIGGTRYFGVHLVHELLSTGHNVTIATRGNTGDKFGDDVGRILLDRTNADSIQSSLKGKRFDVVYDQIAYCSNEIKYLLEILDCGRYIYTSSASVYEPLHRNTREEEFNPFLKELIWCSRTDFPYDEIKRQAECALFQMYGNAKPISVRFPFVIGKDDYTKRLLFYVEHILSGIPMDIDNINHQMSFISSKEAGRFLACLADKAFTGPVNGCAGKTISLDEMLGYIDGKTGIKAILKNTGEKAPYNGVPEYSINTDKATALGFEFTDIKDWIYELLDYYIELVTKN